LSVWKALTDNVNFMARNLTTQVRGISKVVTAVANGDLAQKLTVDAKGEVAALAETINAMTDTLSTFTEQVSGVAREVGIEGKLGGQAKVPNATGTWLQLTDNVNQLAASLTTQIRAISEVATAVTKGDLTRAITVGAEGEVARLKDNINQMIFNLRETTQKNQEQDWLKTNLAKFSSMMQGQKNLDTVSRLIMSELTPLVSAHHGAFFMLDQDDRAPVLKLASTYAYKERKNLANRFHFGEGLVGQCALEKKPILLTRVPADYIQISSGLGEAPPLNIIVLPVLFEGVVKAVIELASFNPFSAIHQIFLDQLTESIGVVLNMIGANMRTEQLLLQSQTLTQELQSQSRELTVQQEELKRSNSALEKQALELEEKAKQLEEQNASIEVKNREVELARASLEEKAEQLSLISKYKSEFLANMSHELRTPLNSLLILAKLLADNKDANLSEKQVEYAKAAHAAQLPAHPRQAALRQQGRQPLGEAGRVREDDLRERRRSPHADQRDPRSLEGGSGQDADRAARHRPGRAARLLRAHLPPGGGAEGPAVRDRASRRPALAHPHGSAASAAGAQEPALERIQVHGAWQRPPADGGGARSQPLRVRRPAPGADRPRVLGDRHGHRHPPQQAEDHLRSVPAGRRDHQPQVRRHRTGSFHLARDHPLARRRDPGEERTGRGQHLRPVPARFLRRIGARARGRGAPRAGSRRGGAAWPARRGVAKAGGGLPPGGATARRGGGPAPARTIASACEKGTASS